MTPAWLASTTTSNPPRRKSQPSTSRQRSLVSRENDSLPFLEPLQRRPPRPSPEHPRPPDPSPVSVTTRYSAGRQRLSQRKGESMRTGEFQKRFGREHNLLFGTAFAALALLLRPGSGTAATITVNSFNQFDAGQCTI